MTEAVHGFDDDDDEDSDLVHCDLCGSAMLPLFDASPSEVNTNTDARFLCTRCNERAGDRE